MTDQFGPLAAIRKQFPGWHPWRSDAGRFWATRNGEHHWDADHPSGWSMTVDADTAAELRKVIEDQEARSVP